MARSIQWLEFLTQRERERREALARSRLLPYGSAQQAAELALLRGLIDTRATDSDLLFQLLQAKGCALPADPGEERAALLREWLDNTLTRRFAPRERAVFWALARLEAAMPSMEQFPTASQVAQEAEQALREGLVGV